MKVPSAEILRASSVGFAATFSEGRRPTDTDTVNIYGGGCMARFAVVLSQVGMLFYIFDKLFGRED